MKPVSLEGNATPYTGGIRLPFRIKERLVYLTNDSDTYDLRVNFDATTTESGNFTLKSGESVSDILPISTDSVSLEAIIPTGVSPSIVSVAYRILGV